MKESQIEAHLVKRVKALGGEVRKVQWIGRRGAPDRLVMLPTSPHRHVWAAGTIWVELKAPGLKAETHQVREHERMRCMGQRVVVIDSIEAVEKLLA
ncbi:VRR-NUC domain-containing protein [Hydrogenophaga sp.]|uniref:VRR-NUC domain-containing protein n=1 Tax=Hydrogenophaga sp. TaxID=1904254 RepID=UPI0025BABD5B|nr:VRR-NUC domain-containing protein [Hydrogenophaga sp.]MBT9467113.1 VRR-NUC domain-containing protein [Hydrogenophaga sp.]